MSNQKKPETKVFSIDEGEWNNEIPGVTRLISINSQDMKKLKEVTSIIQKPSAEATPVANSTEKTPEKPTKISDFGIFIEHQFRLQGPRFVYQGSVSHAASETADNFLKPWQKAILTGMEIDHRAVKNQGVFHEYAPAQKTISEIFAGTEPTFVQLVRYPITSDELSVFQSTQTCLIKREQLLKLIEESQKNRVSNPITASSGIKNIELKKDQDGDDKIELDVA